MDSRRSIKRLLKGGKGPTYHQRVSHVRNKSSYGGSGAGGGLLGAGAGEGGEGGMGGLYGDEFTKETVRVCSVNGGGGPDHSIHRSIDHPSIDPSPLTH